MKLSTGAPVVTEREARFLLALAEAVSVSPGDAPRPKRIARQLGLGYGEAVALVNELHRKGLLYRAGSDRVLSDMRAFLTRGAVRMILRHREGRDAFAESDSSAHLRSDVQCSTAA